MDKNKKIIELKRSGNNDNLRKVKAYAPKVKKKKFKIVNLIFIAFLLYFAGTAFKQYQMIIVLDSQIAKKSEEKALVEKRANELKEDVVKLQDEKALLEVVEKIARNEYKMVKPNETIYIDKNKNGNKFITGIGFEMENTDS